MARDISIWASDAPAAAPQPVATTAPPAPTVAPTIAPTTAPTAAPTTAPTSAPTVAPTTPGLVAIPAPSPSPSANQPPSGVTTSASGFHSAWVDETAYPRLAPGEVGLVTLHFRNVGTEPWQAGVPGRQVNLGVVGDSLAFAELGMAPGWLSPNRPATTAEQSVGPGQVGTFAFAVRAPTAPGVYRIDLGLVLDGVAWLENEGVFVLVTSDPGFHSAWVSQTPWPVLRAGELSAAITLTFRNTGTQAWVRATDRQVNLGVVGDDTSWATGSVGWAAADRPAVQSESFVAPGALGTFTFQVRAPAEPGEYAVPLRLVVDGLTWLEDQGVFVQITVLP
jgi:hypothetical protein